MLLGRISCLCLIQDVELPSEVGTCSQCSHHKKLSSESSETHLWFVFSTVALVGDLKCKHKGITLVFCCGGREEEGHKSRHTYLFHLQNVLTTWNTLLQAAWLLESLWWKR